MSDSQAADAAPSQIGWRFDNRYAKLPERFFTRVRPVPVKAPSVVLLNHGLAKFLGLRLEELAESDAAAMFSGNALPEGSDPIAQAYAGHQYGGFTMLGDGRAILMGEQMNPEGKLFDIQFKGSGQTPYSRRGDGRAALGPMLREYLISEAMHALGIPTTRSLAVVATGQPVYRETVLPGALLTRVASSHIRVGTFEYLAARQDVDGLRILADFAIARHYPAVASSARPYHDFFLEVMARQARLVASWLHIGFVHGVMNTDNMAISGETIDYGPCAFMDAYDPATVFSSIDYHGRYAYGNQPHIAHWNLVRLAEAMLSVFDDDEAKAIESAREMVDRFPAMYEEQWLAGMRRKLGLEGSQAGDLELVQELLDWMHGERADFTSTFRDLMRPAIFDREVYQKSNFQAWYAKWQHRLDQNPHGMEYARQSMASSNPAVIPRNHLVEEALQAASDHGDLSKTLRLLEVLTDPYAESESNLLFRQAPPSCSDRYQTFCGT